MDKQNVRDPLLARFYQQYLEDKDARAYAAHVAAQYSCGTLQRLAAHCRRDLRRAAVLALGFLGDYEVHHTLGRALLDEDRTVRTLAESGIRRVWNRAGNDGERRELGAIIRLNAAQHYRDAVRRASALIEKAPWYAEAWHQRGVAQFHLEAYAEAIRDCHQALELNAYHFPAASLMGQGYLRLDNRVSALESFRRALRLNPDLESVRSHVVRLARMLDGR